MVGVDGSSSSREALRTAMSLTRRTGAALTAVHVVAPPSLATFATTRAAQRAGEVSRRAGEAILTQAARLAGDARLARELHFGDPANVICQRAAELGIDLVVVGSRGLGRLNRLFLGSVSSAVAARAPCSVLIVRPRKIRRTLAGNR
jgi:nucleotide-binding universal stress UspA family protein